MKTEVIPSYKEGLDQLRGNLKQMLPPAALASFDAYGQKLGASLSNILKVKVGDLAPSFALSNHLGQTVSLSDMLKRGKVVLVFYRGSWCPYCNLQLNQLQSVLDEIERLGANLIAISPQTPDASLSMAEKNNFKFEVLSDVGNAVAGKYTTVYRHDDAATAVLNSLGIDFNNHYGDDSSELPVPAVFVIHRGGTIAYAQSEGGDFRNRVEIAEILSALKLERH
jgi:peroxiredoxin